MNVLVLDTYYPAFLRWLYAARGDLGSRPYEAQWRAVMDECFGTADFYSANLARLGHPATEVIANNASLQRAWAREHGLALRRRLRIRRGRAGLPLPSFEADWERPVLLAQIRDRRPDVVHVQDPAWTAPDLLRAIRPHVRLITAQIASPFDAGADFSGYDLVLSSIPGFVDRFRRAGLRSARLNLGFEPAVLPRLRRAAPSSDVVFVGGVSPAHRERIELLEAVARRRPFDWWGYGVVHLDRRSPLRACHRGSAWALEMYERLAGARIALNHHIDAAGADANNMRLYEATGVGTLLLTDWKRNLHELFEPDREVGTYRSADECAARVEHYLAREDERAAIARAGQARTLRDHTYETRMREYVDLVRPLL